MKKSSKLTLVRPGEPAVTPPPRPLGEAGIDLWTRVHAAYRIDDAGGSRSFTRLALLPLAPRNWLPLSAATAPLSLPAAA